MVLELAHKLSDTLNNEKEFKLMVSCYGNLYDHVLAVKVKLLTGIRRFREMSYIIDILVYNDEFETLLSKNVDKVSITECYHGNCHSASRRSSLRQLYWIISRSTIIQIVRNCVWLLVSF